MPELPPPLSPYRTLRRLGRESPYGGVLAQHGDDAPCVLVDADAFEADWPGWRAEPHAHVLAPLDVVRRSGGHDLVLPACRERMADHLDRRERGGRPLSAGEAVTLGVSILRGLGELEANARCAQAQWWLTAEGRPVVAAGAGSATALEDSAALLRRIAPVPAVAAWTEVLDAVAGDRVSVRALEAAEAGLFAWAPPEALAAESNEPRRARSLAPDAARRVHTHPEPIAQAEDGWLARAATSIDADAADILSRVTTALWRLVRAPGRRPRRRVWVPALAAAAVVVVGGLLWPQPGGGAGATAGALEQTPPPAVDSAQPESGGDGPAGLGADADLAATAARLLDARLRCSGDATCLREVQADPAREFAPGPADRGPEEREVVLLDDLGDLAVLGVGGTGAGAHTQIVVISRHDDRWLLRDVYDVAQQPSGG